VIYWDENAQVVKGSDKQNLARKMRLKEQNQIFTASALSLNYIVQEFFLSFSVKSFQRVEMEFSEGI
jgi:hypothetical protein